MVRTLLIIFSSLLIVQTSFAKGISKDKTFDGGDEKFLVLMQTDHPRRAEKPHKTRPIQYWFRSVDQDSGSFGKKSIWADEKDQLLLEGEKLKHDTRPLLFVLAKGKTPGTYMHHLTSTSYGVREWISCKERGAFIYDFVPGKVNVVSLANNSYVHTENGFAFDPEVLKALQVQVASRLALYPGITADIHYVAPVNVATFPNDWNQKNGFALKCPAPKDSGFVIESGESEAAQVAIGSLPSSDPM